jgi:hypothetical protein
MAEVVSGGRNTVAARFQPAKQTNTHDRRVSAGHGNRLNQWSFWLPLSSQGMFPSEVYWAHEEHRNKKETAPIATEAKSVCVQGLGPVHHA